MDKERWTNQAFKALGSHNIDVATEYVSTDYTNPAPNPSAIAGDTGHLELMRIEPKKVELPTFSVRWDQKEDSVNVDMLGEADASRNFAKSREGYRGHKTDKVSASPRTFGIDIETPSTGRVFKGKITLNVALGLTLTDSLNMTAGFNADARIVRSDGETEE